MARYSLFGPVVRASFYGSGPGKHSASGMDAEQPASDVLPIIKMAYQKIDDYDVEYEFLTIASQGFTPHGQMACT